MNKVTIKENGFVKVNGQMAECPLIMFEGAPASCRMFCAWFSVISKADDPTLNWPYKVMCQSRIVIGDLEKKKCDESGATFGKE